jgi:hypothetical protein
MVFHVGNSLIASSIIKLCCQVSDPLNLSGDKTPSSSKNNTLPWLISISLGEQT